MIPRIESIEARDDYKLLIRFRTGECVLYDGKEDIEEIEDFRILESEPCLFENVQVDESRTCIYWNDRVDLPSDTLFEYGVKL